MQEDSGIERSIPTLDMQCLEQYSQQLEGEKFIILAMKMNEWPVLENCLNR